MTTALRLTDKQLDALKTAVEFSREDCPEELAEALREIHVQLSQPHAQPHIIIVDVTGGVADPVGETIPEGIKVEIVDFDNLKELGPDADQWYTYSEEAQNYITIADSELAAELCCNAARLHGDKELVAFASFGNEFYPGVEILKLLALEGVSDASYGNDACPHFEYKLPDGAALEIWFDHPDQEQRENGSSERFMVRVYEYNLEQEARFTLLTNDGHEAVRVFTEKMQEGKASHA